LVRRRNSAQVAYPQAPQSYFGVPAGQQPDEQDSVDRFGGFGVAEPDPLAALAAACPHPRGQLVAGCGVVGDDGFHEVRLAGQEQLPAGFGGGDRGGGHQLGDLPDGARADVVVAEGAGHVRAGTWRRHQA
jgi:hypothetical protein